jgi:hypothetical protein
MYFNFMAGGTQAFHPLRNLLESKSRLVGDFASSAVQLQRMYYVCTINIYQSIIIYLYSYIIFINLRHTSINFLSVTKFRNKCRINMYHIDIHPTFVHINHDESMSNRTTVEFTRAAIKLPNLGMVHPTECLITPVISERSRLHPLITGQK